MYMEGGSTVLDTVPTIMEEVLYNVCDNAVKYNRRGGRGLCEAEGLARMQLRECAGYRDRYSEGRSGTHF